MMNKKPGRREYAGVPAVCRVCGLLRTKWDKLLVIAISVSCFAACTEFFSTSLAPWAARDPSSLVPPVTAGNVQDLIVQAENNPDLSLAILKGIRDSLGSASAGDKLTLEAAALEAAGNATGLASSILNHAGQLSSVLDDPDKAKDLVINAISGMTHLSESRDILTNILPQDPNAGDFSAFTDSAGAEDLVISAAILLAAEARDRSTGGTDVGDFINNFNPDDILNTPSLNLAVSLATAASNKPELAESDSPLKDVLGGLNLVPSNAGLSRSNLPEPAP